MARPKEFDRDQALERALDVFWARGYEATSIGDLVEGIGIGRQSLYDTFGDKRALYLLALDRYAEQYGQVVPRMLRSDEPVRRAIRAIFLGAIDALLSEGGRSCMLVSAAAERCPTDADVKQRYCANRLLSEDAFAARLERAREAGELARHHEPRALARFFVNALQGLQIMAKGGADRQTLQQIADVTLSVLG